VNFRDILGPRAPISIRVRLGLALALALLPVLFLSIVQATLEFRREARDERASLVAASERGAATAKARLASPRSGIAFPSAIHRSGKSARDDVNAFLLCRGG